jgi:hypothetical protein
LFYAGYGTTVASSGPTQDIQVKEFAFLPVDHESNKNLTWSEVRRLLIDLGCRVLVVVDTVRAGEIARYERESIDALNQPFLGLLLLGCDASEMAFGDKEGGAFSRSLLKGLQGAADASGDGIVDFQELCEFVRREVPAAGFEQHPVAWPEPTPDVPPLELVKVPVR